MHSGTISNLGWAAALAAALMGCSDDPPATTTAGGGGEGGASQGGQGGAGASGGSGGAGGSADPLEVVVSFDPAAGELPEGLALRDGDAYVSLALLGSIVRVADATAIEYAQVEGLPIDNAFVTGLVFDGQGRLYAAVPSFVASPLPGVYRSDAGGDATLYATDAAMLFPNDLGFHANGDLYVTDAAAGAVFRVSNAGSVSVFLQDPLLVGDKTICGNDAALFDIGANGLAVTDDAIFVANTDQATLLRIPIESGGAAGTPEIVAGPDCAALGGIDGIARAADGSFYAALNRQHAIARITATGEVSVVLEDARLDFPASVRLTPAEDALYITNFALEHALASEPANPALLRWAL